MTHQFSWHRNQLPIVRSTTGETPEAKKQRKGAYAWKVLHTYPVENKNHWSVFNAQRFFFHVFWNLVPKEGCSCNEFLSAYCSDNPPDFASADSFFRWTWEVHNAVSRKLKKTEFTWAEFKEKYPQ